VLGQYRDDLCSPRGFPALDDLAVKLREERVGRREFGGLRAELRPIGSSEMRTEVIHVYPVCDELDGRIDASYRASGKT